MYIYIFICWIYISAKRAKAFPGGELFFALPERERLKGFLIRISDRRRRGEINRCARRVLMSALGIFRKYAIVALAGQALFCGY